MCYSGCAWAIRSEIGQADSNGNNPLHWKRGTLSTQKNGITCSTEYQHKMKGQRTGNQRAEITSTKLLFHFVIKSKLARTDECVISAIMNTRNLKENSFSIEKEMLVCQQFSQYGQYLYRNHQQTIKCTVRNICITVAIINAVSECYTKWISYFSV